MSLNKPFFRIVRPGAKINEYAQDSRYAPNRLSVIKSYISIEKRLRHIFDYIEPNEKNKDVFSLELYTLILRACTEFESNCKDILRANNYNKKLDIHQQALNKPNSDFWDMSDYKKLELSSKLSKYKVIYPNWKSGGNYIELKLEPFYSFGNKKKKSPPGYNWYNDYNTVKHNREKNFEYANFINCINAVAANLILLYSQFGNSCLDFCHPNTICLDTDNDILPNSDTIFSIKAPQNNDWKKDEKYNFDWNILSKSNTPFQIFDFDKASNKATTTTT